MTRMMARIYDLDGTLVDVSGIRHFVERDAMPRADGWRPDFDAFHLASADCPPNWDILKMAQDDEANGIAVLCVTGRMSKYRQLTSDWLNTHMVRRAGLWMRDTGDYRTDFLVKEEILGILSGVYDIIGAVDDNPNVIKGCWEKNGIPVHVVPGWTGNS